MTDSSRSATSLQSELKSDSIELLKKMIATPSISRDEGRVADLIFDTLSAMGLGPRRHLHNNWVVSKHFDPKKPTILLNTHIDTVKPNSGYTRDPYLPVVEEGRLYGLGSNDAGGSVVGLLAAFRHFYDRSDLAHNLIYAPTAEEEVSGTQGIESLLPVFRRELGIDPACAIVGEPTGMQLAVAEKGLLVLDCVATGRSGHAAREEGDNAIYKALGDITWFRDFRYDQVSKLLGPNKMSVTMIEAGSQHNVVPRECKFVVDVRINELYTHEQVIETVRKQVGAQVQPRSTRLRSTSIALDHPLVRAGIALGREPYGSPTSSDKALMPFPALKMGPGESARSHTADEFITLQEIEEGIDLYVRLLDRVL